MLPLPPTTTPNIPARAELYAAEFMLYEECRRQQRLTQLQRQAHRRRLEEAENAKCGGCVWKRLLNLFCK